MRTFITCLLLLPLFLQAQIVVLPDGKIGIGTETPDRDIQINAESIRIGGANIKSSFLIGKVYNANYAGLRNARTTGVNNYMIKQHFTGVTYLNAATNKAILFRINNKTKMRLSSTGNFGIGTDSAEPSERLEVNGNVKADNILSTSDKRLKSNISNFGRGLKEVLQLNPINFTYNGKAGITSKENQIGLAAQELQKAVPEMVQEFTYQELDSLDEVISEENYLQIVESDIKYLLINAIKEQQVQITELQDQVDNLLNLSEDQSLPSNQQIVLEHNFEKTPMLFQNRPNPNKGLTYIDYYIPETASDAKLIFTAMDGTIINQVQIESMGYGNLEIVTSALPAGRYTYSLIIDEKIISSKSMIVAK